MIDAYPPTNTPSPTIEATAKSPAASIIHDLLIDTPTTNEIGSEAAIEAASKYLLATSTLVVMNPLQNHSLMRFTIVVSQEYLTSKVDTLIITTTYLNFVSKKCLNVDGFYT